MRRWRPVENLDEHGNRVEQDWGYYEEVPVQDELRERVEQIADKYQPVYDNDMNALVRVDGVLGDLRSLLALEYWESLRDGDDYGPVDPHGNPLYSEDEARA
jgi:hypothetical protein